MRWRLQFKVRLVNGTQTFIADGLSAEEAMINFRAGRAEFEEEELDVVSLFDEPSFEKVEE